MIEKRIRLVFDARSRFPDQAARLAQSRPLLRAAISRNHANLDRQLNEEMMEEKERDRLYWKPLKARLAQLRREKMSDLN